MWWDSATRHGGLAASSRAAPTHTLQRRRQMQGGREGTPERLRVTGCAMMEDIGKRRCIIIKGSFKHERCEVASGPYPDKVQMSSADPSSFRFLLLQLPLDFRSPKQSPNPQYHLGRGQDRARTPSCITFHIFFEAAFVPAFIVTPPDGSYLILPRLDRCPLSFRSETPQASSDRDLICRDNLRQDETRGHCSQHLALNIASTSLWA